MNESEDRQRFDLADGLLLLGLLLIFSALYVLGGWPWLMLAVGALLIILALRF